MSCFKKDETEHRMRLNPKPFEQIRNGQKTIELRLLDEKRQTVKEGDVIVFTNTENESAQIKTVIVALHRFRSFAELYQTLPLLKCGYTEENVLYAKASDMEAYYPAEEQEKYGVVGIEISLLCQEG